MELRELLARWSQLRPRNSAREDLHMRWRIENVGSKPTVYLYDEIGFWGTTASSFVDELRELNDVPFDLHVNSEGGDVFDGLAMYNALLNYPGEITGYIDALAASAASFIIQACTSRVIAPTASMMIHDAQGFAMGNAEDMRRLAELLDDASDNIAGIYAQRNDTTLADWRNAMKATSWYRGQAAVDAGLADSVSAAGSGSRNHGALRPVARLSVRDEAIPFAEHGAGAEGEDWTAPTLSDFTDQTWDELSDAEKRRIAAHYVWTDSGDPPARFEDLGGPHHDPRRSGVGPANRRAIGSSRLRQASWWNEDGVQSHIHGHYDECGMDWTENRADSLIDLIPPLANGYRPPLPADFTRLVEANLAKGASK